MGCVFKVENKEIYCTFHVIIIAISNKCFFFVVGIPTTNQSVSLKLRGQPVERKNLIFA